jgi:hypothetical protein
MRGAPRASPRGTSKRAALPPHDARPFHGTYFHVHRWALVLCLFVVVTNGALANKAMWSEEGWKRCVEPRAVAFSPRA